MQILIVNMLHVQKHTQTSGVTASLSPPARKRPFAIYQSSAIQDRTHSILFLYLWGHDTIKSMSSPSLSFATRGPTTPKSCHTNTHTDSAYSSEGQRCFAASRNKTVWQKDLKVLHSSKEVDEILGTNLGSWFLKTSYNYNNEGFYTHNNSIQITLHSWDIIDLYTTYT